MNVKDNAFFHPLRYPKSRKFIKKLFKKYKSQDYYSSDNFQEQMGDFVKVFNEEISKHPISERDDIILKHIGNPTDIINQELTLFVENLRLRHRGNNIFYFPNEVSNLFKHTNIDEISIGNLKFPYKTFYLAFGLQDEFDIGSNENSGHYFDGAYIDNLDETTLSVRLTSLSNNYNSKEYRSWLEEPDITFFIGLEFQNESEYLIDGIDRFIENYKIKFNKIDEQLTENEIVDENTNILKKDDFFRKKRIKRITQNTEKFRDIAKLIFNAICYLTHENKNIIENYTNSPLPSLINNLKKAKNSHEKKRIEAKIKKGGHTKIKICGHDIMKSINSETNTGKELSTHWRRGHWRRQPFGSDMNEIKLIWIKPTLVRKDKGSSEYGHIYDVT